MKKGNFNSAMKTLLGNIKNEILPLTTQTLYQLQLKHPKGKKEVSQEIMLTDKPEQTNPIKFEGIDVEDTKSWNNDTRWFRWFMVEVIKKICGVKNQSISLEASLACQLIPLDKNPGL